MKLAVVGSRNFNDYELLKQTLDQYKGVVTHIVSGGAKGADTLAEKWASENNVEMLIFLPDWYRYGKSAGYIRNRDIVSNSDLVIAFWDGTSKGTKHSIDLAESKNKELKVVYF